MTRSLPSDWTSRAKKVYKRDNYKCQNCGAKGGPSGSAELHAHHGVPREKGGSHKISNLITYCKDCHHAIHYDSKTAPKRNVSQESITTDEDGSVEQINKFASHYDVIKDRINKIANLYVDLMEDDSKIQRLAYLEEFSKKVSEQEKDITKARQMLGNIEESPVRTPKMGNFRDEYHDHATRIVDIEQKMLDNYRESIKIDRSEHTISLSINGNLLDSELARKRSSEFENIQKIKNKYKI